MLLGAAAEADLRAACLLGEMPAVFSQLAFPKASMEVLKAFTTLANIDLDFTELADQAKITEEKLGELLSRVEAAMETRRPPVEEEGFVPEPLDEARLDSSDERRIERLFELAKGDRSKAYELKRELDRLDVFKDYEDRFLDLFKKPE